MLQETGPFSLKPGPLTVQETGRLRELLNQLKAPMSVSPPLTMDSFGGLLRIGLDESALVSNGDVVLARITAVGVTSGSITKYSWVEQAISFTALPILSDKTGGLSGSIANDTWALEIENETAAVNDIVLLRRGDGQRWWFDIDELGAGSGEGSITVKEVDGSPTVTGVTTVAFASGQDWPFVVTDTGGGVATISSQNTGLGQAGIVSLSEQWMGGGLKKFTDGILVAIGSQNYQIELYQSSNNLASMRATGTTTAGSWDLKVAANIVAGQAIFATYAGNNPPIFSLSTTGLSSGITPAFSVIDSDSNAWIGATATVAGLVYKGGLYISGSLTAYTPGGTDVPVADGGTGTSSFTAYAVICGGTTSTGPLQSVSGVGTSGQVLTSNGAGALPTWQTASGGVSDGDKGDITVSSSGTVWTIDDDVVTLAKLAPLAMPASLFGSSASSNEPAEIQLGTGLSMSGTTLNVAGGGLSDGDKGDITVSSSGATWTIDSNAVTDAKFRQSAGLSVVGRSANSTGNVADITASADYQILRRSGTSIGFGFIDIKESVNSGVLIPAHGGTGVASYTAYAVLCGGATSTSALQQVSGVGTSGQVLTSNGAGALPTWQTASGSYTDEQARDAIGTALVEGNGIDITVNDGADTITIAVNQASDPGALTDNTTGTANGTVDGVPGISYAADAAAINKNFTEFTEKINAIIAALQAAGLMA